VAVSKTPHVLVTSSTLILAKLIFDLKKPFNLANFSIMINWCWVFAGVLSGHPASRVYAQLSVVSIHRATNRQSA